MIKSRRILIAPLNWGLGHATRCMPIINTLLNQGVEVQLASDGRAYHLLEKEYPQLVLHELPGYNITYKGENVYGNMFWQLPKIQLAIQKEKVAVRKIVQQQNIDLIISDNRFGCRNSDTTNIFITHQLKIMLPSKTISNTVSALNRKMINAFDECWIPDHENGNKLSGDLSVVKNLKNLKYIGPLSRMKPLEVTTSNEIVVVLSGPEPQRTYLQDKIMEQAKSISEQFLIIGGTTEKLEIKNIAENIRYQSFMTTEALNEVMSAAKMIICRSGYSTIMDLAKIGKTAILIPTPGQPEQEYLAAYFESKNIFYQQSQKELNLEKALSEVNNFTGIKTRSKEDKLSTTLESVLISIKL